MLNLVDFRIIVWGLLAGMMIISAIRIRSPVRATISLDVERSVIFGLAAMMFIFAYPSDRRVVAAVCFLGVIASELLQALFSRKYDRLEGAFYKTIGATAGLLFGSLILQWLSEITG